MQPLSVVNAIRSAWRKLVSRTPCSSALSCSFAATPPITRSSLQIQRQFLYVSYATVSTCWQTLQLQATVYLAVFRASGDASYLSLGLSTYFLNCLTLLRVCSASSLEGSMISALGALDDVFTWLTLALPTQTEQKTLLLILLKIKSAGMQFTLMQIFFLNI